RGRVARRDGAPRVRPIIARAGLGRAEGEIRLADAAGRSAVAARRTSQPPRLDRDRHPTRLDARAPWHRRPDERWSLPRFVGRPPVYALPLEASAEFAVLQSFSGDERRRPEHGAVYNCARPISPPHLRAPPPCPAASESTRPLSQDGLP